MRLSARLEGLLELLSHSRSSLLIDVGCDHGYVSIEAVKRGLCERALACDINKGPLSSAKENIGEAGLSERIRTVLSDGLKALNAEDIKREGMPSVLLCAGMGGALICSILTEGRDRLELIDRLILSPQSEPELVRGLLLNELSYDIISETWIKDEGKYYVLIEAERTLGKRQSSSEGESFEEKPREAITMPEMKGPGSSLKDDAKSSETDRLKENCKSAPYSRAELLFGRKGLLVKDKVLYEYLRLQLRSSEEALNRALRGSSDNAKRRQTELSELIRDINIALEYF